MSVRLAWGTGRRTRGSLCGGSRVAFCAVLCVLLGSVRSRSAAEVGAGWPTHTICSTHTMIATYTSCDPLQDIGLSVFPCPPVPKHNVTVRLSALLRHSVDELYLSADVFVARDLYAHYDEPLCLPDFPRFSFCNRHKGELIQFDKPVKFKLHGLSTLTTQIELHTVLLNQDGHLVSCSNITVTFKE